MEKGGITRPKAHRIPRRQQQHYNHSSWKWQQGGAWPLKATHSRHSRRMAHEHPKCGFSNQRYTNSEMHAQSCRHHNSVKGEGGWWRHGMIERIWRKRQGDEEIQQQSTPITRQNHQFQQLFSTTETNSPTLPITAQHRVHIPTGLEVLKEEGQGQEAQTDCDLIRWWDEIRTPEVEWGDGDGDTEQECWYIEVGMGWRLSNRHDDVRTERWIWGCVQWVSNQNKLFLVRLGAHNLLRQEAE